MSIHSSLLEQLSNARAENLKPLRGEPFPGVSTDSRTLRSGELFIAIRGERFDGHNFVKQAFDLGAAAAVVDSHWLEQNRLAFANQVLVGVPDTLKALGELARAHRRQFDIPVIGIAGSNGKTTTKELVASVLSGVVEAAVPGGKGGGAASGTDATTTGRGWRVLKTEGTLNNHIGVPLTLLRLESKHQVALIELGTNHPGEVATLCEMAEPTHGIITNVMREHMEFFRTLENVARAEGELFDWLAQSEGTGFINVDDPLIASQASKLKKRWRYGFNSADAEVGGREIGLLPNGCGQLGVQCLSRNVKFETAVGLMGRHHVQNALAAAAVGLHFEVDPQQIQSAIESQKPAKHRMEVIQVGDIMILDDTYNANPDSMLAALRTLSDLPCKGRRLAVLGDMLELGGKSVAFHEEIGVTVRRLNVAGLFTMGEFARRIYLSSELSLRHHCSDRAILTRNILTTLRPGDIVLLKGSRGMKLDLVVDAVVRALGGNKK